MPDVLAAYHALVASGELRPDPEQAAAARALDALAARLARPPRAGLLARLARRRAEPPRGAYLWGDVGRGKSMLMDLFFAQVGLPPAGDAGAPPDGAGGGWRGRLRRRPRAAAGRAAAVRGKRRVHFGAFMLEVHARLAAERARPGRKEGDPIPPVAQGIARETRLLAFDEMMVTNSPDAMILSRLFTHLIEGGVTVVATSNRPPRDLYRNGLNREHFLPFIALIEARMDVLALNGPTDYRRDRLGGQRTWLVPNGPEATADLSAAFYRLTDFPVEDAAHVPAVDLPVSAGRTLRVPKALKGVAVFSFRRLCGEARGTPDYLAVARAFHTVILVGVPRLGPDNRNEAARFVSLVDQLYEGKVKLLAAADAEPDALYPAGDGAFEFRRTASRLEEMRSDAYLAKGHGA